MKYVHVIVNTAYTAPYIELINRNFESEEHVFYVVRGWSQEKVKIPVLPNVYPINSSSNIHNGIRLLKDLNLSRKIFIHGLFSPFLLLIFILQSRLLRKSAWAVWGGDLYQYMIPRNTVKARIEEYCRRVCIKRFAELITIRGDYHLAQKWYGATGAYRHAMYSTPMRTMEIDQIIKNSGHKNERENVTVLIGNSATAENNHFEIIDLLKKYRNKNMQVYALLSYGERDYADQVVAYGKTVLGDKFNVVREYMNFSDFVLFMDSMDVIVFNHRRQQAIGNLLLAYYLGKKIFINKESSLWDLFDEEYRMQANDTLSINDLDFENFKGIDKSEMENNRNRVTEVISEPYVVGLWRELFDK